MPPAADKIKDKAPFDVYAMLTILCFLFTGGASWMLYDDLSTNWHYNKEHKPEKAVRITQLNDNQSDFPDFFNLPKADFDEWKLCADAMGEKDAQFPISGWEWPVGYDPLKNPVKANQNNLEKIPADQLNALMGAYRAPGTEQPAVPNPAPAPTPENPAPAPAPTPEVKTPENPAKKD